MNESTYTTPPFTPFQVHQVSSTDKSRHRDSPTSSILKTPTAIFVTSRSSSRRTKKLKFANGPVNLENSRQKREGSQESTSSTASTASLDDRKLNNGQVDADGNFVEVAISPVKRMKVSPESWTAFLEYRKYTDYANETEKTDYTYSRLSKFRDKEIIPGFPIRPNLSRSPLAHVKGSLDSSYTYSYDNSYIKSILAARGSKRRNTRTLLFDSDDETDISTTQYREGFHQRIWRTISQSVVNTYTTFLYYVALTTSLVKDLFSRYILRSNKVSAYHKADSYWYKWNSWNSWIPASRFSAPSFAKVPSVESSWLRSVFTSWYTRVSTFVTVWSHTSIEFVSVKYSQASRRKKLLWLLIPLLLLAGIWLAKAEREENLVSKQWEDLNFSSYKLIPNVEGVTKYVTSGAQFLWSLLSQLAALLYYYIERLLETVTSSGLYIWESSISAVSAGFDTIFITGASGWDILLSGSSSAISLVSESVSQSWILTSNFLSDFFTSLLSGLKHASIYIYELFVDCYFICKDVFVSVLINIWQIFTFLFDYVKSSVLFLFPRSSRFEPDISKVSTGLPQDVIEQLREISQFAKDFNLEALSDDLAALKKKIDDLELELRKEKEERVAGDDLHLQQLERNHQALQKYQVKINHALRRCCTNSHLASSSVRHLLESQADELKRWIAFNFALKSDIENFDEEKLAALIAQHTNRTGEDVRTLQAEFTRFVSEHRTELTALNRGAHSSDLPDEGADLSAEFIRKIVNEAIQLYDADKTGKTDFALETAGGQVQSIRCTETYVARSKSYVVYGWTMFTSSPSPRDAISPGMAPGQCWAFVGSQGYLVLQLSHIITVTGFTMEHISRNLAPSGHIESAPRNFTMWGLKDEDDKEPHLFGEYEYLDNNETLQYFPVVNPAPNPYKFVELKITSNHGNPTYTCLYRIRVHGKVYLSYL